MGDLYDLEHIRRGQRLFGIFLERFGVEHFLAEDTGWVPRLDGDQLEDALDLALGWLERRSDRRVPAGTRVVLRKRLKKIVLAALAERMVRAGF